MKLWDALGSRKFVGSRDPLAFPYLRIPFGELSESCGGGFGSHWQGMRRDPLVVHWGVPPAAADPISAVVSAAIAAPISAAVASSPASVAGPFCVPIPNKA